MPPKQITKKKYNQKPTYETLRQSLEAMKVHCLENGVTKIAIPRYGVFFVFHKLTLNLNITEYPQHWIFFVVKFQCDTEFIYKESENSLLFDILYFFWIYTWDFRIGCGLDRLTWKNVAVIIEEVFRHTDVAITVYSL